MEEILDGVLAIRVEVGPLSMVVKEVVQLV